MDAQIVTDDFAEDFIHLGHGNLGPPNFILIIENVLSTLERL